ncbi:EAL domain-containing protein [Paraglaciecola sp. Hal342]
MKRALELLLVTENFKALCDQAHIAKNRAHIGTYGFFDEGMNGVSKERLLLSYSLKKAINDSQLKLFYQPQVCLKTMRVMGVEALARWYSPEHGNVSPEKFIQLAEKIGEIDRVSMWAIKAACEQMAYWRTIGVSVPTVSVNLSQLNLNIDGLDQYVDRILKSYHLPASCLILELTETATSELTPSKMNMILALRDIGVRLSMDDFGTGFSSLANLASLPVSEIKIDKSFVQAIATDERFNVLVSSIIDMGNKLGLTVVAEGVESKQQLDLLRSYNCPIIQGFIYSKAVSADELDSLVKKNAFNSKIKGIPCASPRIQYDRFTQMPELYFNRTPLSSIGIKNVSNKFQDDVEKLIKLRKKLGWKSTDATEQELQQKIDTTVTEKNSEDEDFVDPEYHSNIRAEAIQKAP